MLKACIVLVLIVSCWAEYDYRNDGDLWADHPYAVSINAPRATGRRHITTGTILNNRWFLSVASYHGGDEPRVFQVSTATMSSLSVIENIRHPLYNPDTLDFNLCLLKIDRDIEFSEKAQPIELFSEDSVNANLTGTLIGWEQKSGPLDAFKLYSVDLKTAGTIDGFRLHFFPINDDVCLKDVGGPFVVDNKVLGITTLDRVGCGSTDQYVTRFDENTIKWINSIIV